MKQEHAAGRTRKHAVLADDACPNCGTLMQPRTAELGFVVNGENVPVPDAPHLACPSCHEIVFRYEDSKVLQERAIEIYRQKHALFSAAEIRALRQALGLTQAQFAELLHLGLNTVSRWEAGRNVQNEAMDVLLRLVRDVPATLDYLKKRAA